MNGRNSNSAAGAHQTEVDQRTLIYIPIIHTHADMGALGDTIQRLKVKKLGPRGWERNVNLVDKLWVQIEQAIERLALPYDRVRLYQDGLPVCSREAEIVAELAKAGAATTGCCIDYWRRAPRLWARNLPSAWSRNTSSSSRISLPGSRSSPGEGNRAGKH